MSDVIERIADQSEEFYNDLIDSRMKHFAQRAVQVRHFKGAQAILRKSDKTVYYDYQSLQLSSQQGPLDIYSAGMLPLLLKFAGTHPSLVSWDHFLYTRGHSMDYLFHIHSCSKLLTITGESVNLKCSLEYLKMHLISLPRYAVLYVENACMVSYVRRWMQRIFSQMSFLEPHRTRMIQSNTRMIVKRRPTLKQVARTAVPNIREFQCASLLMLSDDDRQKALEGRDLFRLPVHGRLPCPKQHFTMNQTTEWARQWLRSAALPMEHLYHLPSIDPQMLKYNEACRMKPKMKQMHDATEHLSELVMKLGETTFITVEDKDPSTLWLCNTSYMMHRWVTMLQNASDRWAILELPREQVLSYYRMLYDLGIPRNLHRENTSIIWEPLPYMYPTIKLKRYSSDTQQYQLHLPDEIKQSRNLR